MKPVFKYFSNREFVDSFLNEGTVFFNSLSYFTACEEDQLRDEEEGSLLYQPTMGLQVNNLTSRSHFHLNGALISKVRSTHRIYVFCTSLTRSNGLAQRFKSKYCLEISDIDEFERRLRKKMRDPVQRLKNRILLSGAVSYSSETEEPGPNHALPEKIIFRKHKSFSVEDEYRLAFSLDKNAFDPYNVDYSIGQFTAKLEKLGRPRILKIGPLLDICKLVHDLD